MLILIIAAPNYHSSMNEKHTVPVVFDKHYFY